VPHCCGLMCRDVVVVYAATTDAAAVGRHGRGHDAGGGARTCVDPKSSNG
jgi:hypothetical protein